MNLRRALFLLVALGAASTAGNRAAAQCAAYGGGFGYGYWDAGRLYSVLADNVLYYAAFPPVYYSYPVPRTYGYSPFAYPPGVMTPEVEGEPMTIENPYFEGETEEVKPPATATPAPTDPTTRLQSPPGPQVVLNPFIKPLASPKLAATR